MKCPQLIERNLYFEVLIFRGILIRQVAGFRKEFGKLSNKQLKIKDKKMTY